MRTRILFQAEKVQAHVLADVRIKLAEISLSGGRDFNAVGQVSVPQFPHEIAERNGPLLFRLFQGGPGVFDVDSVYFFLGQAL
jgi:hypothetical protein